MNIFQISLHNVIYVQENDDQYFILLGAYENLKISPFTEYKCA